MVTSLMSFPMVLKVWLSNFIVAKFRNVLSTDKDGNVVSTTSILDTNDLDVVMYWYFFISLGLKI